MVGSENAKLQKYVKSWLFQYYLIFAFFLNSRIINKQVYVVYVPITTSIIQISAKILPSIIFYETSLVCLKKAVILRLEGCYHIPAKK